MYLKLGWKALTQFENFPPVSEAASRDYYHRRIIKSGAGR